MGTEILELNLAHELASMYQDPLFLVLLNLGKAYDTLDHGLFLTILEVYCDGPQIFILLAVFWDQQETVTHQNRYPGPHLKATRWTTQGGLI